jgi:hypothetical protein
MKTPGAAASAFAHYAVFSRSVRRAASLREKGREKRKEVHQSLQFSSY